MNRNWIKKNVNSLKMLGLAGILAIASVSNLSAQGIRTSYFMDNVQSRLKLNPALQPARGYFNIPVVGGIGVSASSSTLSIDDFIDIIDNENDFLKSDKFINKLEKNNSLNLDVTTDVIAFGFYSGKAFWDINLGIRAIASTRIPKSMFEFARNSDFLTSEGYDIKDMELHADAFVQVGVGYSRTIMNNLTVGARVKALIGAGNLDAQIDEIKITPDIASRNWRVKTRGSLQASVKGLEATNEEGYISEFDFDSPGVAGYGLGFDFGVSYKLFNHLNLSASIVDLGFIKWNKSSNINAVTDSEHTYGDNLMKEIGMEFPEEYDGSDVFDLDLIRFEQKDPKARTTKLRSTLYLGAEYAIFHNKLSVGILSSTQFLLPKSYSELTVSANYRPKNWFGASLSYSFLHSEFKTLGLGLKFGPLFIGSDYILTKAPKEANRVNAFVGISLPLGKKRADYMK